MKKICHFLKKVIAAYFSQKQVKRADQMIATAYDDDGTMFGVAIDEMHISPRGIDLICAFEGFRLKAYDDGIGVWTIGFGTTVYPNRVKVKKGDCCTEAQAKSYMAYDLKQFERAINSAVTVHINQNQFDALVSLAYNIGTGAFEKSTLLKKLNCADERAAADQFDVWVNAGGKRIQGLVNRRKIEKELFEKPSI